ncbi:MAG: hypothetical protein LBG87_08315 [Spirochaetaceae bacterium]|nr:hypothetical protein [Spirochaetaceae bacterium]
MSRNDAEARKSRPASDTFLEKANFSGILHKPGWAFTPLWATPYAGQADYP